VIRQSARFTTTGAATRGWERALCRGSARVQTLWTLRRELPSLRRYHRATRCPTGRPALDAARRGVGADGRPRPARAPRHVPQPWRPARVHGAR
jgi:hypothetical protein